MLRKSRLELATEVPDSSMADIAFLLMIFFMVTTSFFNDKGLSIMLPGEATGSARIPKKNLCKIFINAENRMFVDDNENQSVENIGEYVKARMKSNDKLVVVIKTDENASYDRMISVFDEMKKIDMRKVSLQVNRRK